MRGQWGAGEGTVGGQWGDGEGPVRGGEGTVRGWWEAVREQ